MDYSKIDKKLEEYMPELLNDLAQLVSIDSERTDPQEGMPFGKGNAECMAAAVEIVKKCGLDVKNYDNYVVTADLEPDAPKGVDILAHLDVVPAGDGWTVTTPFSMKIEDGRAYGRGTDDDKGPALCALYAMRAIKELGIPLKKNARLILGSDEECGGEDLDHYFEQEIPAPYSLSPDGDFPMINIEKGGLHSGFHSEEHVAEKCPRVISMSGGLKINVIPDKAEAVVEGLNKEAVTEIAAGLEDMDGISFSYEPMDENRLQILVQGSTGHASEPHKARNAVTALIKLLSKLPLSKSSLHDKLKETASMFPHGDYFGRGLGVEKEDEVSGKTVLSLTICSFSEEEGFTGMFDCRACLSANDENTKDVIYERFKKAGLEPMTHKKMYPPHHVPEDSYLVQTLLDIYEGMTGKRPKPLCIGGGSYVHDIENGIAFGCGFEGLDNRIHAADEFITLEQIMFSCRIYARTIIELCSD